MKKNKRALTSLLACILAVSMTAPTSDIAGQAGTETVYVSAEDNDFREEDKEIPEEDPAAEEKGEEIYWKEADQSCKSHRKVQEAFQSSKLLL